MKIEHVAIWARDLKVLRAFYEKYFDAQANDKYRNESKQFESYFLTLPSGGRLELMHRPGLLPVSNPSKTIEFFGYSHVGFSVGTEAAVDSLTARLVADGFALLDGPRRTGDGYYESKILDPEGNRIVIMA